MKLSYTSISTPEWPLEEMIAFAGEAGYDAIELRCDYYEPHAHGVSAGHRDVSATTGAEKEEIRGMLEEAGIEICLLGTSCAFATSDADERAANVAEAIDYVELADDLGASYVRVFGGELPDDLSLEEATDYLVESLDEIGDAARERDVTVVLEEHDEWTDPAHLVEVVEAAGSENVGLLWHLKEGETRPLEVMGEHLDHTHVREFGPFFEELIDTLEGIGYDGYLSYERAEDREMLEAYLDEIRPLIE